MSELCVATLQAIAGHDPLAAYPLSDYLRLMRSELNDLLTKRLANLKEFIPANSMEQRQVEQLRLAVSIVARFDQVHATWADLLADPYSAEAPLPTLEGWHALIEKRLPASWDMQRDLVTVIGEPNVDLLQALSARGQSRILVVRQPESQASNHQEAASAPVSVSNGPFRLVDCLSAVKRNYFFETPPRFQIFIDGNNAVTDFFRDQVKGELISLHILANVSRNTAKFYGPRWFNQGLDNLPAVASCQHVSELRCIFAGVAVVIISPGPSLDKNVADLRGLEGRAILVCPAQSIRRLHLEGIYPDFVAIIDPQDYTAEPHAFFDPSLIRPHQSLIASVTSHPNVLALPYSRKFVFGSSAQTAWIDETFNHPLVHLGGSSISVALLNLAIDFGAEPIVLVGQDLAYASGKRYAEGTAQAGGATSGEAEQRSRPVDHQNPHQIWLEVDGYYGGKVPTQYNYKVALYEMEMIVERLAASNSRSLPINATEGGANIKGFLNRPLATVVASLPLNPRLANRQEVSALFSLEKNDHRTQAAVEKLTRLLHDLRTVSTIAQECRSLCTRLVQNTSPKIMHRLGKREQKMAIALKRIRFLGLAVEEDIEEILASVKQQSTATDNLTTTVRFYDTILGACATAEGKIAHALRILAPATSRYSASGKKTKR
jgi:hypothetical protein